MDVGSDAEAAPLPSDLVADGQTITQDAVFGEVTEDGPNYRSVRLLTLQKHEYGLELTYIKSCRWVGLVLLLS